MIGKNTAYNEKFDIGIVLRQIHNINDMKISGDIARKLKEKQSRNKENTEEDKDGANNE